MKTIILLALAAFQVLNMASCEEVACGTCHCTSQGNLTVIQRCMLINGTTLLIADVPAQFTHFNTTILHRTARVKTLDVRNCSGIEVLTGLIDGLAGSLKDLTVKDSAVKRIFRFREPSAHLFPHPLRSLVLINTEISVIPEYLLFNDDKETVKSLTLVGNPRLNPVPAGLDRIPQVTVFLNGDPTDFSKQPHKEKRTLYQTITEKCGSCNCSTKLVNGQTKGYQIDSCDVDKDTLMITDVPAPFDKFGRQIISDNMNITKLVVSNCDAVSNLMGIVETASRTLKVVHVIATPVGKLAGNATETTIRRPLEELVLRTTNLTRVPEQLLANGTSVISTLVLFNNRNLKRLPPQPVLDRIPHLTDLANGDPDGPIFKTPTIIVPESESEVADDGFIKQ